MKIPDDKKRTWLGPPHLINNLENKLGRLVGQQSSESQTLGTTTFLIVRPTEDIKKISIKDQGKYRSGIGMPLYQVKHSRTDLANASRELSKENDVANPVAYKELMCNQVCTQHKKPCSEDWAKREFRQNMGHSMFRQ